MQIFIGDFTKPIKAEVMPLMTPTLDETLEVLSFVLISNRSLSSPYKPMTRVKVLSDSNEASYFVLTSDNVELYSLNPVRYKHSIVCTQSTRELSKHIVRNTQFVQPANPFKESYNASAGAVPQRDEEIPIIVAEGVGQSYYSTRNYVSEKLTLSSREKVKNAYIKIGFQAAIYNQLSAIGDALTAPATWHEDDIKTFAQFQSLTNGSSYTFPTQLTLRCKKGNTTETFPLAPGIELPGTQFLLNQLVPCDFIKEKWENGYNDFELIFDSDLFISGTIRPLASDFMVLYAVQLQVVVETYYYSLYDVLYLLQQRQKKESTQTGESVLFELPTESSNADLYNILKTTVAPNFTFTQCTLYECIAEVYRTLDAIISFKENDAGTRRLDIEYFNDLNNEVASPKLTGLNKAIGEDKFANSLISYYQDGMVDESFPSEGAFAPVRSAEVGVPAASDHYFILPHKINYVNRVIAKIQNFKLYSRFANNYFDIELVNIDITRYVVEKAIWGLLAQDMNYNTNKPSDVYQINSVPYSRGDNKIDLSYSKRATFGTTQFAFWNALTCGLLRMIGFTALSGSANPANYEIDSPSTGDYVNVTLNVNYQTSIDGRTKSESIANKYNGDIIIDQFNGAVDLNKMGLNIFGLSLKLGEESFNATHKITTWANRVKVGDLWKDENDNLWVANVCSYTIQNGFIQGKVTYVKNFNGLALFTRLQREKRLSNISSELTLKSEENVNEYLYYSSEANVDVAQVVSAQTNKAIENTYAFAEILGQNFVSTANPYFIDYTYITNSVGDKIYIPTVIYGSGNMIFMESSFESPISAGIQTKYTSQQTWFSPSGSTYYYYSKYIKYSDDDGFLDQVTFNSVVTRTKTNFDSDFPIVTPSFYSPFLNIQNFKMFKQSNEVLAFNYGIAFLPIDKSRDFISSKFLNQNSLVTKKARQTPLYLYYSTDGYKYSILDVKGHGSKTEITRVDTANTNYEYMFTFIFATLSSAADSWAICDDNGDILFASNNALALGAESCDLYFYYSKDRLNLDSLV